MKSASSSSISFSIIVASRSATKTRLRRPAAGWTRTSIAAPAIARRAAASADFASMFWQARSQARPAASQSGTARSASAAAIAATHSASCASAPGPAITVITSAGSEFMLRRSPEARRREPAGVYCDPRRSSGPGGGGAQVEVVIGGLFRGHLAAGGQQPAGMGVVGRAVDRFDAEQLAIAVAEYREFALVDRTAQRGVVMARRQPGDLQAQRPLLAPEPWQGGIGVRLAEDPVGDAARVIGGVLHRFEPRHVALRVY